LERALPPSTVLLVLVVALASAAARSWVVQGSAMEVLAGCLEGRVVVVDPGHGGVDPGATGKGGLIESDLVLDIARRVKSLLEEMGCRVVLTRDGDYDLAGDNPSLSLSQRKVLDMRARAALVASTAPDVLLSIHANSFPAPRWFGAQCFYRPTHPASAHLAACLQRALAEVTRNTHRRPSSNVEHYLLETATMPACTVEVGFLSNPHEERLLADAGYRDRVAWALVLGLIYFFSGQR